MDKKRIILDRKPAWQNEGYIILVALCREDRAVEFVTWFENADGETFSGHYNLDLEEALKEYQERT